MLTHENRMKLPMSEVDVKVVELSEYIKVFKLKIDAANALGVHQSRMSSVLKEVDKHVVMIFSDSLPIIKKVRK